MLFNDISLPVSLNKTQQMAKEQMIHSAEIRIGDGGLFMRKVRRSAQLRKQFIIQDRKGYPQSADVSNIYIRCASTFSLSLPLLGAPGKTFTSFL